MKMTVRIPFLAVLASLVAMPVVGDELEEARREEARKQEAFRAGFAKLVNDLNYEYYDRFVAAIDREEMVERIYGLRLIDPRIKKSFEENLEESFPYLVQSGAGIAPAGIVPARGKPDSGLKVTLLGIESRGDRGRAVIRVDLDNFQFNYQEFDLYLKGSRVFVNDWNDYLAGMSFSESVGRYLVLATPSKQALRKLLDLQNASDRELYLFGELMKAARDGNLDKYFELRDGLAARVRNQRIVVETSVLASRAKRQRAKMVGALGIMAEQYPEEPFYALMLLDYFFPQKKFEEGTAALQALADELGFEDAAMDARMSAAQLAAGNVSEAVSYADAALEREPGLELGWLSALNARNAAGDYPGAVEALVRLEGEFGYDLGPEALKKSRVFAQLLESEEFAAWLETR